MNRGTQTLSADLAQAPVVSDTGIYVYEHPPLLRLALLFLLLELVQLDLKSLWTQLELQSLSRCA